MKKCNFGIKEPANQIKGSGADKYDLEQLIIPVGLADVFPTRLADYTAPCVSEKSLAWLFPLGPFPIGVDRGGKFGVWAPREGSPCQHPV